MKTYEFIIVASGLDPNAADFEDRFFEAGCDDATISFQRGAIILEFVKSARSFSHALASATRDVRSAGAKVERIEPDHLVSMSEIARRSGLTRAAVSLYAAGDRAEGFPPPVARVMTKTPLWDWVAVSRWMFRHHKLPLDEVVRAKVIKGANLAVEAGEGRQLLVRRSRAGSDNPRRGGGSAMRPSAS